MDASSSSKRPRPPSNASLVPSCLVDGCSSDLSLCRDYHRRHKVCELHSKTSTVLIKGKEQRFCQQCSRFHSLGEFDEGKRSCRKRLEGHNRRRRKPQPDAYAASPVISNQTTRYIHFGGSHLYPSNYSLGGGAKSDDAPMLYDDDASGGYGARRVGYFRDVSDSVKGASLMFGEANVGGMVRNPDGFNRVVESNCALSLLSSPNETREINLGQFSRPGIDSSAHSFLSMVNYNIVGGESEPLRGSGYMPDGRTANIHGQMIQTLPDGSAPGGAHHTLSFSWE